MTELFEKVTFFWDTVYIVYTVLGQTSCRVRLASGERIGAVMMPKRESC